MGADAAAAAAQWTGQSVLLLLPVHQWHMEATRVVHSAVASAAAAELTKERIQNNLLSGQSKLLCAQAREEEEVKPKQEEKKQSEVK